MREVFLCLYQYENIIKNIIKNMNKKIISIFLGIFALAGLIWLARPSGGDNPVPAPLASNRSFLIGEAGNEYDFGTISMAAGRVSHAFRLKNAGEEAVLISKMYTSCMCTTATLVMNGQRFGPVGMPGHGVIPKLNQLIGPNEEATVEVVFDPAAHGPAGVGRIQRAVILENNAGRLLELKFAALVTP